MFDIGWSELLLIGIVALIVIGPKDLPDLFRTLGRFTAKARGMAREFSRAMEQAADESGVKDVAKDLRKVASPKSMGLDAVKDAARKFEEWDPVKSIRDPVKVKPDPAPEPPTPAPPEPAPLGPETQKLADAQAGKRAARKAPEIAAPPAPRKPRVTARASAGPAVGAAGKTAAKPRARKQPAPTPPESET